LSRRSLLAGSLSASCFLISHETLQADAPQDASLQPWRGGSHPVFSLETLGGGIENLASRGKQIVIVHFFATWCEPCRREIGSLQDLSKRLPRDRFAIIGVDVGEVEIRVKRFFDSLPVTFPIALDYDNAVAKAWGVDALPTTFVLGRNLIPKFYVQGDLDWNRPDVERLLTSLESKPPVKKRSRRTSNLEKTNQPT
jgi:thiol-disulfide isomerase/thioredoxin